MTATQLAPVLTKKSLENTYQYAGGTVTILMDGGDTGGVYSMWEGEQKPGSEPPLHVHHINDETFYILEGSMRFLVGDQVIEAGPGCAVFAPRGIPHTFKITSEVAKTVTFCTPAGFEEWFRLLGKPVTSFDLPEQIAPFSPEDFPRMMALGEKLGTEILQRQIDF